MKKGGIVPIAVLVVIALVLTLSLVDKPISPTGLQTAEINEAPRFVGGSFTVNSSLSIDLRDFFVDPEGEALGFAVDDAQVSMQGFILTFIAPLNFAGEYVVNVQVSDGANTVYKPLSFIVEEISAGSSALLRGQLASEQGGVVQPVAEQVEPVLVIQPSNKSSEAAPQESEVTRGQAISEITISAVPTQDDPLLNSTDGSGASGNAASVNETLTVYAQNVADGDGDSVQNITDWRVNGTSIAVLNMPFETNETTSSSGAVQDYSSFVRNGTLVNGPLWSAVGKVGGAYTFDGVDDYVSVPSPTAFGGVVAVSAWIRSGAFVNGDGLGYGVSPDAGPSSYGWLMHPNAAGTVSFIVSNGSANGQAISTSTLANNQWQHIAGTYDGSFVRIYVNGTQEASVAMSGDVHDAGGSVIELGKDVRYAAGRFLTGSLDEIFVFNRSLSAAQVQQLYLDGSQGNHSLSWLGSSFNRTDIVGVAVTPNDNTSDGITKFTNNVTLLNAVPAIAQVILNSTDGSGALGNNATTNETLTVHVTASDGDADAFKNITNWYLNNMSVLVLNVPFEGGTNTTFVKDYSAFQNNGSFSSSGFNSTGGFDGFGAFMFAGLADTITIQNSSSLSLADNFSVELRFFKQGSGSERFLISKDNAWRIRYPYANHTLEFRRDDTSDFVDWDVGDDVWTHLVATKNSTHIALYINGSLVESKASAGALAGVGANMYVGSQTGLSNSFSGRFDEIRMYNRSLSAEQISALYNNFTYLVAEETSLGDVWGVQVTSNDRFADSSALFSNNVTIIADANNAPSIQQVILNSTDGSGGSANTSAPGETLTVVIVNVTDADADGVQNITDWRRNGTSIAVLNMPFESNISSTAPGAVRDYARGNNGTLVSGVAWTPIGKVGGVYTFDGTDDYMSLGNNFGMDWNTVNFSVSVWANSSATTTSTFRGIIGNRFGTGSANWWTLGMAASGSCAAGTIGLEMGGSVTCLSSNYSPNGQGWNHYVVTKAGTTIRIYVNSTLAATGSSSGRNLGTTTNELRIGQWFSDPGQFWQGQIDEVLIFNRTLSAAQIYQLYLDGNDSRHMETLVSDELSVGDVWSVAVTPNDNQNASDGATVISNNVTIQNAAQAVSLSSPVNNYSVDVSSIIPLNCSFSSDDLLINVSVYHSLNGTFALRESANISGNGSYQFNASAESLLGNLTRIDRTVLWNCRVCTSSVCSFNESNATFGPWDLGNYVNTSHYPDNFSVSLTRNGSNRYENLTGTYTSRIFSIGSKVLARRISWNGTAQSLFRNNTNFELDTTGTCPQGWTCSNAAAEVASSTDGQGCVIATGISGARYIKAGCDADQANLTSDTFGLPLNISRIQFLRAGGADSPSGFFIQRVRDNATLCSATYGANTDTFALDNCTGLAPYGGELVRIFINDRQTGGFGKVYVDRIMLQDSLNGNLTPLTPGNISFMFRGCVQSDCSDYNLSGNYTNGTVSALSTSPGNYFQYQMNVSADNSEFSPYLDTRSVSVSFVPVGTFYKPNDVFTQTYDINGTVNATITNNTFYEYDQYITFNHSTFGRRVRFYARFNTSDVDLRNLTINATTNATAVSIGSGLLGVDFGFSMFVPNLGQGVTVCPNANLVANTNITCPSAVGFTHNDALINNSRSGYSITIEDGDYRVDNIFSTGLAQGATTNLTIYDDTNDFPLGANASRYLTDIVGFYANFTKGSVPANTTDGACQIQFNVSGTLGPVIDMTYASGPRVFVRNQTFAEFGTFYYNVTCSDAGDTLNTSDDFVVQSPVQFTSRNYTFNLSREDGETARLVIRNFASYFVDNITGNVTSLGVLLPSGFLGALHPDIALDLPSLRSYNATVGLTLSLSNESNYTFNASINSVLFNVTLDTVPVTINLPTINETNYNFSVTPSSHTFVISDQTNAAQVCSDTSVVLTAANTGSQNITTFNMTRSGTLPIRVVPDSIVDYVLPVGDSFNVTVYALINETTPTSSVTMNFSIGSVTRTVTLSYTNTGLAGWASLPVANSTTVSFGPTLTGKCANGLGFTGSITIPEPYDLGAITAARLVTTFGESTCPEGYATFADLFVNGNLVIDDERPFGSASGTITPATLARSNNISMTSGPAGGHWCASGASSIQATFSNTATTYCAACSPSGDIEENFTDAIDNDCDSLTDCDDSDSCGAAACAGAGGLHAYFCPPEELCSNGVDDNQNGLTDCQDVSLCCSASACSGSTGCANLQPNICDYGNYNTLCVIQTNKTVSDLITELRMNDFTVRGPRNTVNIGQFRLNASGDVTLESGVVINGRGRGYGANLGPGAPSSHGGGAELYDSPFSPNDMGSGSANSAGGGLFRAIVGGRFTNDGAIDTNGTTAASIGSSGAAGGGIFVNASEVYGTGRYYAPGGGPQAGGTAGGGGRIAIWANNAETINRSRFNVTAPTNPSRSGTGVLVDKDTQTLITLEKFNFETIDGTYFPYNVSASGSLLGSNSSISVNGSFFVMSNSTLAQFGNVFNFTVYSDEMNISSASVVSGNSGGGGGTSGSNGGAGEGGLATIHGSALAPRDFGDAADGNRGAGSFAFIGDRFVNNGTITMLGAFSGVIANSGGAGGSIFVNASNVSGTGVFQARGGSGGSGGTGGGGGRIAVWGNDVSGFSHSQFNVSGGGGGTAGGAGTVILVDADDGQYFVVQNFRFESVDFPTGIVSVPRLVVENATLRTHTNGTSVLNISSIDFDRSVLMSEAGSRMNVTVFMSEMNFTGNSSFVGNGKGYANGQGPGVGANGGIGPTHGGQGTGNPQTFVGSALVPADFGSGGTVGFGGALFRIFGDSLVLEGLINLNATGTGVSSNSGGAGGAFFANVSNFSSNAYIDVRGAGGGAGGGSGGGGKIAILADNLGFVNLSRLNAVGALTTTEANGTVIVIDRNDGVYYLGHAFRFQSNDFAQGFVNVSELIANSSLVRFAVNTTINSSGNVSFLNSHVFGNTNDRLIVLGDVITLNGSLVNAPFLDFRFDDSLVDNTSTRYRSSLSSLRLERVNVSAVNYSAATTNVHNLSRNIILQQNLVRVNSTNASGLNRSANITFYNITTPGAPILMVDDADTGSFVACPSSRCTLQSYSGGVVLFNVSRFTSYSSSEGIFLEKNDSPDPVLAGSTLTYTLFINNSDGNIENVTLVETYPSHVVFNGSQPVPSSGNNTFLLGSLATNQTFQVNITVNVSSALTAGFVINNTANLTFNNASGSSFFVNVTESTTVANVGPSIQEVVLNSSDGSGESSNVASDDENLTVVVVNATDPDGQPIQNITDWRVNGTSVAVLNMPFETNSSSTVVGAIRDYSTGGINGTLGGGVVANVPVWNSSGRVGGAYTFDGVNDYINATNNSAFNFGSRDFAVEFWARRTTIGSDDIVVGKDDSGGSRRQLLVFFRATNVLEVDYFKSGDVQVGRQTTATFTDAVNFHHYVVQRVGDNFEFYYDGALNESGNSTAGTAGTMQSTLTPLLIGRRHFTGFTNEFGGSLDEVRIYNRSLSGSQVQQLYQDGLAGHHMTALVHNETGIGDIWSVAVTPNDNAPNTDGVTVLSNNVTISAEGNVTNLNTSEQFVTIQQAVDDAQTLDGHVINVSAGTYTENVVVDKQLTIQGAGPTVTFVRSAVNASPVFNISDVANVQITGFTISNASGAYPLAAVFIQNASDVVIEHNYITSNNPEAILLYLVNDSRIQNNTIRNNSEGVGMEFSRNMRIVNNTIADHPADSGFWFGTSSNVTVANNTFVNNTGITVDGALLAYTVDGLYINGNEFQGNIYGLRISDTNNTYIFNNFINSSLVYDFQADTTQNATIENITILTQSLAGVQLENVSGAVTNVSVTIVGSAIGVNVSNTGDLLLNRTRLVGAENWLASSGASWSLQNTTFETTLGAINIVPLVSVSGLQNVTSAKLNVTLNHSFLNSTNLSFLNTSAQITLRSLNFTNPHTHVDLLDNGTTVDCHPPRCVIQSYSGGVVVFNVTSFTGYEATEATTSVNATVLKIDSPDPVNASGILNYTITVNLSSGFMYNTTVGETYPPNVSFISSEPTPSSGNNTFSIGNLSGGEVFVVNISLFVGGGVLSGTVLHNLANVTFQNSTGGFESYNATADTTVVSCPQNITQSTTLIANISCPGTAVSILSNNLVLDCAGYTVSFSSAQSGQGINAVNRSNVTIQNCNVVLGNSSVASVDGVLFGNTANSTIIGSNVTVSGSGTERGINVQASSVNNSVLNVRAQAHSGLGFVVSSSSNMTVANIYASSNGSNAAFNLTSVSDVRVRNSTGIGFNGSGIHVNGGTNVSLMNNTAASASPVVNGLGMLASFMTTSAIEGTVGYGNLRGIMVANLASSNITNNSGVGSTETGFMAISGSGSRVVNNSGTGAAGMFISISSSAVVGNRGAGIGAFRGIHVSGDSLDVANNSGTSGSLEAILAGVTNSNVTGNNATSVSGKSMLFSGAATGNTVGQNRVESGTNVALEFQQASNGNLVINNIVQSNASNAIGVEQSNDTLIVNNSVSVAGGTGIMLNGASNNTVLGNNVTTGSGIGLRIAAARENTVANLTVLSSSGTGMLFTQANNTRVSNVTLSSNTGTLISLSADNDNNAIDNTVLRTNGTWLSTSATTTNTNLSNATFESVSGSIFVPASVFVPSSVSVTVAKLNTSLNLSFLNSTNLSFLNTSAQITLNGISFTDPLPVVDFQDDGTFASCDAPQCVEVSFSGGTYVFNVSSFTSYAVQENLTFTINLSVDKYDSPDPVARGSLLSYQIEINSSGNASALNVTLIETYPPNVAFVSSEPAPSSGNNTFSIGNLSPSSSFIVNITVNVSGVVANGTVLNNSIQVIFANSGGVNSTINESELTTVLGAPVIVSIKSDAPDPVTKGSVLNYTILVNNTGDDTAFNVTLSESYPSGVSFVSAEPVPAGNATFSIGALAPGEAFLVNISVAVGSNVVNGTILNNSVNLSFRNVSGNQAAASDSELTTVLGFPSVTAAKADSPDPVANGSVLSYAITITNSGDEVAYNVTVAEGYDANVTFNGSSPTPIAGNNTFNVGNLSPGQSTTINITVNVSTTAAGVLNNTVNVSSENLSGQVSLVSAAASTTVSSVVPVPAGGAGSGGGGSGSIGFRQAEINRSPESVQVPAFPSVAFPQFGSSGRAVEIPKEDSSVSQMVDVIAPSEVAKQEIVSAEEEKSAAFSWPRVPMNALFAFVLLLVVGALVVVVSHRGNHEYGQREKVTLSRRPEPSSYAFRQLERSVARQNRLIAQGKSSLLEKLASVPALPKPQVSKQVLPSVEKRRFAQTEASVLAPVPVQKPVQKVQQIPLPKPQSVAVVKAVQVAPVKKGKSLLSRLFHKSQRPIVVPTGEVRARKNKSVQHIEKEISLLNRDIERSLKLLNKSKSDRSLNFSSVVLPQQKKSWWSRHVEPKNELPVVSALKAVRVVAVSRSKTKPVCKVPSAGTRDSLRELKKSEQKIKKVASFVKRIKKR